MQRLGAIDAELKEAEESKDEAERRRRQVEDERQAIADAGMKYQRACVSAVLEPIPLASSHAATCGMLVGKHQDRHLRNAVRQVPGGESCGCRLQCICTGTIRSTLSSKSCLAMVQGCRG